MRPLLAMLLLSICLLLALPPAALHAAPQTPNRVLLVYDSLAAGTSREGNVESLERLLASFGAEVTVASFDTYRAGMLKQYDKVAAIVNAADLDMTNDAYAKDFAAYTGSYLHVGQHAPAVMQTALGLRLGMTDRESVTLSIAGITQSAIAFNGMPYIVRAFGTKYGSFVSVNGNLNAPYGVSRGRFAFVPYFEKDNLSELAMGWVLKDWFGYSSGTAPDSSGKSAAMPASEKHGGAGSVYALFEGVYPFSDLDRLGKLADKLYESGVPFIVSVAPVFSNTEYPAMQRYLDTLRYVQSRNGSVILSAPAAAPTISQDVSVLHDEMAAFLDLLANNGIAPLGMGAELYWTYDQHYATDAMSFFDSVILSPNRQPQYRSRADSSVPFRSAPYLLKASELRQFVHADKLWQPFPMDTALAFDLPEDDEELDRTVDELAGSWMTFADFKSVPHSVATDAGAASSSDGMLRLNGKDVDLNGARQEISNDDFAYTQKAGERSFKALFTVQNNIFIVLILSSLVVFVFFLVLGYRLYRKKYIKMGGRL